LDESLASAYIARMISTALATRAPWFVAGPLIGLLVIVFLWFTNKPFGALGGYIEVAEWTAGTRAQLEWRPLFIVGVVAGGLLFALLGPGWQATVSYGSIDRVFGTTVGTRTVVLFAAGILIGAGGRIAAGCTSGHGICGTSLGSPASFACTATFMATGIGSTFVVAWLFGV
jgi:uncharacterized protein